MSDVKCPVCKTGNVEQGKFDKEYFCDNEFCPSYDETDSSTYDILIRTRKVLEIAKNAMNSAVDHNIINCVVRGIDPRTDDTNVTLCNALEQIIALEQKAK